MERPPSEPIPAPDELPAYEVVEQALADVDALTILLAKQAEQDEVHPDRIRALAELRARAERLRAARDGPPADEPQ